MQLINENFNQEEGYLSFYRYDVLCLQAQHKKGNTYFWRVKLLQNSKGIILRSVPDV